MSLSIEEREKFLQENAGLSYNLDKLSPSEIEFEYEHYRKFKCMYNHGNIPADRDIRRCVDCGEYWERHHGYTCPRYTRNRRY